VGRDDSRVVFGKEFPREEGNVRWNIVVMQQLAKFGAESSHIFTQSL
jgi:hypothetical protein